MLNLGAKKEALKRLEGSQQRCEKRMGQVVRRSVELHELRVGVYEEIVRGVETYVSALAGAPKELVEGVTQLRIEYQKFDSRLDEFRAMDEGSVKVGKAAGATVLAGAGLAALGPSAAMAVATTFGTASTGTAISALSGAAATNAALAWLGGGAVAAGGGGMASGSTLLALAGPIGWGIGGVALVGAGTWAHFKNKKIAEEANEEAQRLENRAWLLNRTKKEIIDIIDLTKQHSTAAEEHLEHLEKSAPSSYAGFDAPQKQELAAFVNNVRALGELLSRSIDVG